MISILLSEDSYLIQRELDRIKKEVLTPGTEDFNFERFSAKDPGQTIISSCQMLPMMADLRLVIVNGIEDLKKSDLNLWEGYFSKPSPQTHLVLIGSKVDGRLKAWQMAKKSGWIKEFKPPYPNQMPQWLIQEAQNHGLRLSPRAASCLADSFGNQLMSQVQALEVLGLYVHPKKEIEEEAVSLLFGGLSSKTVFDFTDYLGKRQFGAATSLLNQMLQMGEPPVRILFLIVRHFRILILVQDAIKNKLAEGETARLLGVHPFFVKDYLRQGQNFNSNSLKHIYSTLVDTDRGLKRSPLDPSHVLNQFLMQACLA